MKNFFLIITTLFILFAFNKCKSTKNVNTNEKPHDCIAMSYTETPLSQIKTDDYTIDSVFIIDNCLNLWVSYSGGCGYADFELFFTDNIINTPIPKTELKLTLSDNDECREIINHKMYYDLSFFRDYAIDNGITILISGKSILYKL